MNIGYPYDYGDELSFDESLINVKDFVKTYGVYMVVLGLCAYPSFAQDSIPAITAPNVDGLLVANQPTVHRIVKNKGLQGSLAGVICTGAVMSGNPVLGFACGCLLAFAMK